jgi:hypothetical protein
MIDGFDVVPGRSREQVGMALRESARFTIAPRRNNSAHLHRPWRATVRFSARSPRGFFHSRRMPRQAATSGGTGIVQLLPPWIAFLASTSLSLLMVRQPSGNNRMWFHEAFGDSNRGRFVDTILSGYQHFPRLRLHLILSSWGARSHLDFSNAIFSDPQPLAA